MSSSITTKLSNNCFYLFCTNIISVINAATEHAAAPAASAAPAAAAVGPVATASPSRHSQVTTNQPSHDTERSLAALKSHLPASAIPCTLGTVLTTVPGYRYRRNPTCTNFSCDYNT